MTATNEGVPPVDGGRLASVMRMHHIVEHRGQFGGMLGNQLSPVVESFNQCSKEPETTGSLHSGDAYGVSKLLVVVRLFIGVVITKVLQHVGGEAVKQCIVVVESRKLRFEQHISPSCCCTPRRSFLCAQSITSWAHSAESADDRTECSLGHFCKESLPQCVNLLQCAIMFGFVQTFVVCGTIVFNVKQVVQVRYRQFRVLAILRDFNQMEQDHIIQMVQWCIGFGRRWAMGQEAYRHLWVRSIESQCCGNVVCTRPLLAVIVNREQSLSLSVSSAILFAIVAIGHCIRYRLSITYCCRFNEVLSSICDTFCC